MPSERPAHVALLAGLPAAGKTTLARQLEQNGPAVRFTLDEWMLRMHGLKYDDPDYAARLEPCQRLIWDTAVQVLRTGVDVVLDWNQWSRQRRALWAQRSRDAGFRVVLYHLDVPIEVAIERALRRPDAFTHKIDEAGVRHLATIFEPPAEDEGIEIVPVVG